MKLEPHHRAGRTRSWREEAAIGRWEAANQTPVRPAQTVPGAPNGVGSVSRDVQPLTGRLKVPFESAESDPEETP